MAAKPGARRLYKDDVTGAVDLAFAPGNPKIGYCAIMEHYTRARRAARPSNPREPPASTRPPMAATPGRNSPRDCPAAASDASASRPTSAAKPYSRSSPAAAVWRWRRGAEARSDSTDPIDGGAHWTQEHARYRASRAAATSAASFSTRNNSNVVYVAQTSLYRSDDGGQTFSSYKGAPGGDDNHALWIDPTDSNRMMMASDQGGTISMDGGKSWSTWYNQPTGQIYHLSTDNRYPYWVYGTQQDSGSVGTLSRGDYGEITFMDWDPVGGYEFGYIVPDPLNNNLVYAGGPSRGVVRIDRTNRQVATVSPAVGRGDTEYRMATNPPLALFAAGLARSLHGRADSARNSRRRRALESDQSRPDQSRTGVRTAVRCGRRRARCSPPCPRVLARRSSRKPSAPNESRAPSTLSRPRPSPPAKSGSAPTTASSNLPATTAPHWQDVSPPGLGRYTQISIIEASHFDANTAYAAVDRHEENDFRAALLSHPRFRQDVAGNLDRHSPMAISPAWCAKIRSARACSTPERKTPPMFPSTRAIIGLRCNSTCPNTSVRDLVVHGDDLVAATYGRAFWILDDVTPLRQIDAKTGATSALLFRPEKALRVRLDLNQDTPIPPDMPAGENPPNGAIVDYYLNSKPSQDVTIGIYDSAGKLVREYSTKPEAPRTPSRRSTYPITGWAIPSRSRAIPARTASCGIFATPRRPCCATSIPSPRSTAIRPACRWARW